MGRRMHLWHLRTSLLHVCFDLLLLSLERWQHLSKFKRKKKTFPQRRGKKTTLIYNKEYIKMLAGGGEGGGGGGVRRKVFPGSLFLGFRTTTTKIRSQKRKKNL